MKQISDEIQRLDTQYSVDSSDALYKKRVQLQSQYNLLTSSQIEKQLLHTKRFFEQGDKAGKLLAYQARTEAASRPIPRIRLASDDTTSNPIAINSAFVDYYSKLYSSETSPCDWDGPIPLVRGFNYTVIKKRTKIRFFVVAIG